MNQLVPAPRTVYSQETIIRIMTNIMDDIENGSSLIGGCQKENIDAKTFYRWADLYPNFRERYDALRARDWELSYEKLIEVENRMLLPETDPLWLNGKQAFALLNSITWRLERMNRARFGKEIKTTHVINIEEKILLARDRIKDAVRAS